MLPPAKPVGITEFRDSSTRPPLSLFWTGTDIADSANAGNFSVSSGATVIIAEPEERCWQMIGKCPVCDLETRLKSPAVTGWRGG